MIHDQAASTLADTKELRNCAKWKTSLFKRKQEQGRYSRQKSYGYDYVMVMICYADVTARFYQTDYPTSVDQATPV